MSADTGGEYAYVFYCLQLLIRPIGSLNSQEALETTHTRKSPELLYAHKLKDFPSLVPLYNPVIRLF
jgi:hypothetical protein